MVGTTWKSMSPQDKAPYERVATDELERYMDAKRTFEALHRHYSTLHYGAQEAGVCACCTATSWTAFSCTGTTACCTTGQQVPSLTFISIESLILFSQALHPHYSMLHDGAQEGGTLPSPFFPSVLLMLSGSMLLKLTTVHSAMAKVLSVKSSFAVVLMFALTTTQAT